MGHHFKCVHCLQVRPCNQLSIWESLDCAFDHPAVDGERPNDLQASSSDSALTPVVFHPTQEGVEDLDGGDSLQQGVVLGVEGPLGHPMGKRPIESGGVAGQGCLGYPDHSCSLVPFGALGDPQSCQSSSINVPTPKNSPEVEVAVSETPISSETAFFDPLGTSTPLVAGVLDVNSLNRTHCLHQKWGVVFCTSCGNWSVGGSSNLVLVCNAKNKSRRYGGTILRRIASGLTPTPEISWPIDALIARVPGPLLLVEVATKVGSST